MVNDSFCVDSNYSFESCSCKNKTLTYYEAFSMVFFYQNKNGKPFMQHAKKPK